ncbi:MAG: site-specific integrase [Oscillospiraceae bacterium]|nr:site-specific integrase [Oscillospiraceae bacterium]
MKQTLFIKQLGEYFNVFLPSNKKCSKNTIASYADGFLALFQFFKDEKDKPHYRIDYSDITAKTMDEYILWLQNKKKYSAASQKQRLSALSSFLKYASGREMNALSAYNAVSQTRTPKVPRMMFPYFSPEEISILLSTPKTGGKSGSRDVTLLALLYDSGARAQEICDIMIGDITFAKTSIIRIHGKGNKTRAIPISSDVVKLIKRYLAERGKTLKDNRDEHLFPSQRSDRITTACIRNLVRKYVTLAKSNHPDYFKEEGYSPHSFRHSKAVHMLEAGVPIIYIRNFLGHESVQTTEIYLRIHQGSVSKILKERKTETRISNTIKLSPSKNQDIPDFIKNVR